MNHLSKDIAIAEAVTNDFQFMQDVRRHDYPIHARKFNDAKRYTLTSFVIAFTTSELRELVFS